ncbi:MAG TPA: ComEC/Rec2 family competence protein [Azospirillum sp.]|nr:ComEC/Rec2 family competence protein [Azospirillum sp.]
MSERILFDGDDIGEDAAPRPPPGALARALGWPVERLLAERERWALWVPAGIGLGTAGYFALPMEPAGWIGTFATVVCAAVAWAGRRWLGVLIAAVALLSVATGFTAAQLRTALVEAPVLRRETGPVVVTGRVIGVEALAQGSRIALTGLTVERMEAGKVPARVRLRLRAGLPVPPAGAMVRVRALLHPPPAPAEPGAYDFQRHAFFDRIGAVGTALTAPEVMQAPPPTGWRAFTVFLEGMRQTIAARVHAVLPEPAAAVTVALLNGQQTGIGAAVMADMRNSGLAHLLSISGLHITVVAMLVFGVVRALLALVEPLALRWPIKKIAAVVGLLAAVAYTMLVGAPVPTLRSVLMTGVVLLAIVVDRSALSVRLIAFAAVVALLVGPEELVGPSFQMSFGAVLALIAAYEVLNPHLSRWHTGAGWLGRAALYLGGLVLTSAIATLATTPFSLFHFQQIAFYGVFANMLAVPLTSFWVMPWSLIVYLLMPLGWEGPAVTAMGWGVSGVIWTAKAVSDLPGATAIVPAMPLWGLVAVTGGGLWLCLWSGRWRLFGLGGVMVGLLSPAFAERPDVLVSGDGRLVAVRTADGGLSPSTANAAKLTTHMWAHRDGRPDADEPWPKAGRSADGRLACDALGCIYQVGARTVAVIRQADAMAEDCGGVDVVISLTEGARHCRAPLVIDVWTLRREGAHALYLGPDGVRAESVRAWRGSRPWTVP